MYEVWLLITKVGLGVALRPSRAWSSRSRAAFLASRGDLRGVEHDVVVLRGAVRRVG
jgi:hypothetical protein